MTWLSARFALCIVTAGGVLASTQLSRAQVPPSIRPVPVAPTVPPLQPTMPITPSLRPTPTVPSLQPVPGGSFSAQPTGSGQIDAPFAGAGQPGPAGPRPGLATFDPALTFVPPNQLGIVDRYVKEQAVTSAEAARDELSTVTVTPEGRVETAAPKSEDVEILLRALQNIELAPQRPRSLLQESDQQGLGVDEAGGTVQAESVIGQDTRTPVTALSRWWVLPAVTSGR